MQNKKVIYTALFGPRGDIQEPSKKYHGWDFVCFTDRKDITSKIWDVRIVEQTQQDPTRNARMYKVLPHKFLAEYDISVWHDANMVVQKNLDHLVKRYLTKVHFATFNHKYNQDSMECIYEEAANLLRLDSIGRRKDDPELIRKQIKRYRDEGYPENNGLAVTQVLIRKHNEDDVVQAMEMWWDEISHNSKRDQLSFNYAAWKTGLEFVWLPGDSRKNEWFRYYPHEAHPIHRKLQLLLKRFL